MTPGQAGQQYGATASEWSFQRGELYPHRAVTLKQLAAMADDETVAAMFYAMDTTLAQVEWSHEPRDNGEESESPAAVKAAKFADSLFSDMDTSFHEYVEGAVSFMLMGFSLSEVLYRQRRLNEGSRFTDALWGVKAIIERPQLTISKWVVKDGVITGVQQSTAAGREIPIEKCLHLTIRGGANAPQGRSYFVSAHRPYMLKRRIQDSEAIGIERDLVGLPVLKMPQEDIDLAANPTTPEGKAAAARVAAAQAAVQDMRMNNAGGLVMPSDPFSDEDDKPGTMPRYSFEIVTSAGSRTIDTRSAIRDYDLMIMRTAMMQFLRLGDRAGGSYALSDTQSSLALRAIKAIVKKIAFEWKKKVLTSLFLLNGMDLRYLPELGYSDITEDTLEELGSFLESVASAKEILDEDEELYNDMTRRLGPRRNKKPIRRKKTAPDPSNEPTDVP